MIRLPGRIAQSSNKFQEVDRIWWLSEVAGWEISEECMVNSLRDI